MTTVETILEILSDNGLVSGLVVGVMMLLFQYFMTPRIEARRVAFEEHWKSKEKTYHEAIQLINEVFASYTWKEIAQRNPSAERVTSTRINATHSMLLLVTDDARIPEQFESFFKKKSTFSPATRAEFFGRLRVDLYGSKSKIDPMRVPYFHDDEPEEEEKTERK